MGAVIWNHKAIQSRHWERTDTTKNARYPARPFMQNSPDMVKKLAKVHEKFKDALKG
jgi:phage gpG-like protein